MHSVFGCTNLGISMMYWWIQVGGFGRVCSYLASYNSCQLVKKKKKKQLFHKSNKMGNSRSRTALKMPETTLSKATDFQTVLLFVWLFCLWTQMLWLLSRRANKADAGQFDQWSPRVHWEGTQGFTTAGLTTKGTKTSVTYCCLAHWWDTKLASMKPPTTDWSSQHQSPSWKSSLFQTSRVLIQAQSLRRVAG